MVNVFISYAREDVKHARKLYNDLKRNNSDPWLDAENILPGQNWKTIIRQAINNCSYFIALLSNNSISKRGYVQKELKIAIEILEEFPLSTIFLIPIRLEECEPTYEIINDLHVLDFFPSYQEKLKQLLRVLCNTKDKQGLYGGILRGPSANKQGEFPFREQDDIISHAKNPKGVRLLDLCKDNPKIRD